MGLMLSSSSPSVSRSSSWCPSSHLMPFPPPSIAWSQKFGADEQRRILNSFSSPFINSINFLRLLSPSGVTTFGAFGWCAPGFCLRNTIAYEYAFPFPGGYRVRTDPMIGTGLKWTRL